MCFIYLLLNIIRKTKIGIIIQHHKMQDVLSYRCMFYLNDTCISLLIMYTKVSELGDRFVSGIA